MAEVKIRGLNPATDFESIYTLNEELGKFYPKSKLRLRLKKVVSNPRNIVFVAVIKDEVVGYIQGSPYEPIYSDSLIDILGFVVKQGYRNLGVGTLLLERMEQYAESNNYAGITLASGMDREYAHKFYESRGYHVRKEQKNYMKFFK